LVVGGIGVVRILFGELRSLKEDEELSDPLPYILASAALIAVAVLLHGGTYIAR
jgi:hypothetical protein